MHMFIAALGAALAAASVAAPSPTGAALPARAAPASLGIDPEPLAALDADIASGKFPLVDSLLVMRCGEVVLQPALSS